MQDRFGGDLGGTVGRPLETLTAGEQRRKGRRVRAARAVRRRLRIPRDRNFDVALTIEEPVDGLRAMPARDDDCGGAERVNRLGKRSPLDLLGVGRTREDAGLLQVRRHDRREWEESLHEHGDGVVPQKPRARACNHRRIHDEWDATRLEELADRLDDRGAEEHAGLRCIDADVVEHGFELGSYELGRHLVNRRHATGVLRGQRDDRTHPVAAETCERLQVSLDPGSAARVRACDREAAGDHWPEASIVPMRVTAASWETLLEGDEVAYLTRMPAVQAQTVGIPSDLHPRLAEALAGSGITELYSHQANALTAARLGDHVLVATGTASGKSLAFNLPVLDALAAEPKLRALYLYPTKALAQDQARVLHALRVSRLRPAIYDGDTETERRWQIRKWANLILTNPDMLHVGVLPHHDRWGDVLQNLRFVVVDEAHVYRGVFGSHVANVLRRLRRIAAIYGAEPQFLLASATIGNPGELGHALLGEQVSVVAEDGAPRAERTIGLWNPVLLDSELGLRASPLGDGARLLAQLVERGLRTICFAKSRKAAELIHRFAVERLDAKLAARLSPYRAGYTPTQRREIERRLVEGDLLGVTATHALELGIDIGLLDCAISVGFPGTVASLRQQWGRAGRRDAGLAVLVASEDALDQFFMREPETLLARRVEAALLDHANPRILDGHVRAAAFEAPISDGDRRLLGDAAVERAEALAAAGELTRTPAGFAWAGRDYPAARISLRSTGPEAVSVVDAGTGTILGLVEKERAYSTVHDGAIYLHLGESYRVLSLDLGVRAALVEPFSGDYYTQTKRETTTAIERQERVATRLGIDVSFGEVSVTEQVIAYQKRSIRTQEAFELCPLEAPPQTFSTEAIWFCPTDDMLEGLQEQPRLLGALHAAEHSLIALLPLWAMCDRWDIGGLSTNLHPQTGGPAIFIYDGHPGGVGITRQGFLGFEQLVGDAYRLITECKCRSGCPSCVQSPKCGNLNEPLAKAGAAELMHRMLDR